jgi:hypothetical protein
MKARVLGVPLLVVLLVLSIVAGAAYALPSHHTTTAERNAIAYNWT